MLHYHESKYVCVCVQSDALEQDILHYHSLNVFVCVCTCTQ